MMNIPKNIISRFTYPHLFPIKSCRKLNPAFYAVFVNACKINTLAIMKYNRFKSKFSVEHQKSPDVPQGMEGIS